VALAVVAFLKLNHVTANEDRQADASCVEGVSVLNVAVDPDIAGPVQQLADSYNATKPVVRDHCVKVMVTARQSPGVAAGLTGPSWNEATLGPRPALWIPESSRWVQRVRVPGLVRGDLTSLASSPIVLAAPPALQRALAGAKVSWADLPKLQQGSLDTIGLSGWGGLGLAMPATDATLAVVQSVGEAVSGTSPLSDDAAKSGSVRAAVSALAAAAPSAPDPLTALATRADPTTTSLHTVAATARQVGQTRGKLVGYQPAGGTRVADYPAALLSGSWVDETQNQVAGLFTQFMTAAAQQKVFVAAGFAHPTPLPALASKAAFDTLTQLVEHPIQGVFATVLLDTAGMGVVEGSDTRLDNVVTALRAQLDTMPATSGLGVALVTRDDANPDKTVAGTSVLSDTQREKLAGVLRSVRVLGSGSNSVYPALETAFQSALNSYTPNLVNTVLLITSGPNDDSNVSGSQLLTNIGAVAEQTRPVRIDVLVVSDTDDATMRTLAKSTGGTYLRVPGADATALGAGLGAMLAP
jgi:hypothetical protein